MKKRPIVFGTEMVREIISGRKTETRRVVKPQPAGNYWGGTRPKSKKGSGAFFTLGCNSEINMRSYISTYCPYGKVGDQIWVKETFAPCAAADGGTLYKADCDTGKGPHNYGKWTPSIHMPKNLSRINMENTGISVERLNEIQEENAINEGVRWAKQENGQKMYFNYISQLYSCVNATESFKSLWQSIYGEKSWDENPYVFVIKFKKI